MKVFLPKAYQVESAPNGGWIVTRVGHYKEFERGQILGAFSNSNDLFEFLRTNHQQWNESNWGEMSG